MHRLKHENVKIEVAGHTDNLGSSDYNLDLSIRRAKSVQKFLVEQGVSEKQLESEGRGETQPVATNETSLGRGKNRRVEFKVL